MPDQLDRQMGFSTQGGAGAGDRAEDAVSKIGADEAVGGGHPRSNQA